MTGNWAFVIAAYGVTWAVILGYFVRLRRGLRRGLRRAQSDYDTATAAAETGGR